MCFGHSKVYISMTNLWNLVKGIWLKYCVGYGDTQEYWRSRWHIDIEAERQSGIESQHKLKMLTELMLRFDYSSVLEIGCGKGKLKALPGYVGLDFIKDVKPMVNGDIVKLPFKNNAFDVVLSHWVLMHIPENKIMDVVKEIQRVCRYGVFLRETMKPTKQPHCFNHDFKRLFMGSGLRLYFLLS